MTAHEKSGMVSAGTRVTGTSDVVAAAAVAVAAEFSHLPSAEQERIATAAKALLEFLVSYRLTDALALSIPLQLLLAVVLALLIDEAWRRASRD